MSRRDVDIVTVGVAVAFAALTICWCSVTSQAALMHLADSTDGTDRSGILIGDSAGLCAVFIPCTPISFTDSTRVQAQTLFEKTPVDGRFQENGVVYASIYFDNDLIVRGFRLGTMLPAGLERRDILESLLMSVVDRYFQEHVLGTMVRTEALSYPGGRTNGVRCQDGFSDLVTHSMNGLLMTEPRHGQLLLRLEFIFKQGELKMNRLALASVIIRP